MGEANYESIDRQAVAFCNTYGPEFGVTQESLAECQTNIQRALEEKIVNFYKSQQEDAGAETPPTEKNQKSQEQQPADPTFQVNLDIQGSTVQFTVEANYESI